MLKKKLAVVLAVILLVTAVTVITTTDAFAGGPQARPFSATMEGSILPDGTGVFDMVATHLGNSSGAGGISLDGPDASGCFSLGAAGGGFIWTAANGDQVFTTIDNEDFSCFITGFVWPVLTIELSMTEEIIGGTGRFEDATGKVTVEILQTVDLAAGTNTFTGTKTGVIGY